MTKKVDGRKVYKTIQNDTTITNVKFGSGYKKKSRGSLVEVDVKLSDPDFIVKSKAVFAMPPSHEKMLKDIENEIISWLSLNELPTSVGKDKFLPITLRNKHADTKGVIEASMCLLDIVACKSYAKDKQFQNAYLTALNLVGRFYNFKYSILEPIISQGHAKRSITSANTLTDEEVESLFCYFNSDECLYKNGDKKHERTQGERLTMTVKYCLEEFEKKISDQTLRKNYFKTLVVRSATK